MDPIIPTAIVAGAFATIAPREIPRVRLGLVLGLLSVIPDLDVIGFRFGVPYEDVLGHRGFTHSILFAVIMGFGTPLIAFPRIKMLCRVWWALVALAFTANMSHGLIDAFTDAGLGIGFLIPFDDNRYFAPWRPLATSPLSVTAFINGPANRILTNEFIWVGLPLAFVFGILHALRRFTGRRDAYPDDDPDTPT